MLTSKLGTDRQTALTNLESYQEKKEEWLPLVTERLSDQDAEVRKDAVNLLAHVHEHAALPKILALLNDPSDEVRQSVIQAATSMGTQETASSLIARSEAESDPELKTSLLKAALELGNARAIPSLIDLVKAGGVFADDAYDALHRHLAVEFKRDEIDKAEDWWHKNKTMLYWDEGTKTFRVKRA